MRKFSWFSDLTKAMSILTGDGHSGFLAFHCHEGGLGDGNLSPMSSHCHHYDEQPYQYHPSQSDARLSSVPAIKVPLSVLRRAEFATCNTIFIWFAVYTAFQIHLAFQ